MRWRRERKFGSVNWPSPLTQDLHGIDAVRHAADLSCWKMPVRNTLRPFYRLMWDHKYGILAFYTSDDHESTLTSQPTICLAARRGTTKSKEESTKKKRLTRHCHS